MKYKWLLFDADGTLFDYDRAEKVALKKTFDGLGYPWNPTYLEAYRTINAGLWLDFEQGKVSQADLRSRRFQMLFETASIPADPIFFSREYLSQLASCTFLIEGAEALIRRLHGKFSLLLITNGLKEVQRPRLARSSLRPYFPHVVISEEVGAAKPDARIFDEAFRQMDHPRPGDVLIIGDSLTSDMAGGHNYGTDTCWFNPAGLPNGHEIQVSYEIRHLPELLAVVGLHAEAR